MDFKKVLQKVECGDNWNLLMKIPANMDLQNFIWVWNDVLNKPCKMRHVLREEYFGTNINKDELQPNDHIVCENWNPGFYYSVIRIVIDE